MPAPLTLETSLSELLYDLCSDEVRSEVEEEIGLLLRRYAPTGSKAELTATAIALTPLADIPPGARLRLRLWAAAIRRRAEIQG